MFLKIHSLAFLRNSCCSRWPSRVPSPISALTLRKRQEYNSDVDISISILGVGNLCVRPCQCVRALRACVREREGGRKGREGGREGGGEKERERERERERKTENMG